MNDIPNLYCKVFVDAEKDIDWVVARIAEIMSGKANHRTVSNEEAVIDVEENDDADAGRRAQLDGFLFYRFYLDVEPNHGVAKEAYVKSVASLLKGLSRSGVKAVAACDFEDELPRDGRHGGDRETGGNK